MIINIYIIDLSALWVLVETRGIFCLFVLIAACRIFSCSIWISAGQVDLIPDRD